MNSKYSNISKWVFGVLALITVVIAVLFFINGIGECKEWLHWYKEGRVGDEPPTKITDLFHTWSYVKIGLGVVLMLLSALFTGIVKGVNIKKLLILLGVVVVNVVIAYLMSKNAVGQKYVYDLSKKPLEASTNFWVTFGLNFFYVTFAESILAILYSVVFKAVKK